MESEIIVFSSEVLEFVQEGGHDIKEVLKLIKKGHGFSGNVLKFMQHVLIVTRRC